MSGKILIVDDLATNRIVLKARLSPALYEVIQAADGATALALAQGGTRGGTRGAAPDLMLLDLKLPDMSGLEVLARLRADPDTADLPVIVISATDTPQMRLAALEAGADEILAKPVDGPLLLARLRCLIRARETRAELGMREATCRDLGFAEETQAFEHIPDIALVALRPGDGVVLRTALAPLLGARIQPMTRAEALASAPPRPVPDLFVLVARPGGTDEALALMSELRSRPATRHAGMMIGLPDCSAAAVALDMGAGDVICGRIAAPEVALRLTRLAEAKRQCDRLRATARAGWQLAVTDPLTGLYNRRYALPHLARIGERAQSTGRSFAVMLLDLDRFKQVNDTYGHAAGDAVLRAVARRLVDNLRAGDLVARIGGEEFLVVMPDADLATGRQTAERICRVVEAEPVELPGGGTVAITLSIGLALGDPAAATSAGDPARLVERADHALLAAKADGRNQVIVSRPAA